MLKISNTNSPYINKFNTEKTATSPVVAPSTSSVKNNYAEISTENYKAYMPSFSANTPSEKQQIKTIASKLDAETVKSLKQLQSKGILSNKDSNDGSTVLDNLYKIATEPRIIGLSDSVILKETIKALENPFSITQKFGDIPEEVANKIQQETGQSVPQDIRNLQSQTCTVASMEFNLAMKKPAEFARLAENLSGKDYSAEKKLKLSDFASGTAEALWLLRTFNIDHKLENWDDITIKLKPDRSAIVRARIQTSYKDPNERSCVDVLMQSAFINMGSQHSYNSMTDKRIPMLNDDSYGLTDLEKNVVEQILFESPKVSVVYQYIDSNGYLQDYNCSFEETKSHILNSLKLGQNVIIGYCDFDENKKLLGGHEITIIDYKSDKNGDGFFICNDTDDDLDRPIVIKEEKLLPLIHHAGIAKDALNKDDVVVEPWKEIVDTFQQMIKAE